MSSLASFERLHRIGLSAALMQSALQCAQHAAAALAEPALMRVTEVQREGLTLHDGTQALPARLRPHLRAELQAQADAVAVGDWVLAERNALAEWWVHARVPPQNQLARRLHDGRDKVERTVIVANVDTALLVMGLDHDFSLRRMERFVALAQLAGVEPVVVLTKADLCSDAAWRLAQVQRLLPRGTAALAVNALQPEAALALEPWLQPGRTLVLMGSSGTGKSTLTNTLTGQAVAVTGANRSDDSRGRHTTTARSLHTTPQGACLIDTPGLRTLRLDTDAEAVQAAFGDIATLASQCRFRDCRHQGEPGCAVIGSVDDARLRNFHKLQREAARDQMTALERKAMVQQWKARSRAGRRRAEDKRG